MTDTVSGEMTLPKINGKEIAPGIWAIGEPHPIPGTDRMHCLAQVGHALAIIELRIKFSQLPGCANFVAVEA